MGFDGLFEINGATPVLDYTRLDFTKYDTRFGVIFDALEKLPNQPAKIIETLRMLCNRIFEFCEGKPG